jgi:hypothetical protein
MAAPTQPVQLGDSFAVNFNGAMSPTTTGYLPKDGWKKTPFYELEGKVEDLAGNPINRSVAGAGIRFSGSLFVPAGDAPADLKPGDTISLTPVVNGEVTGTAVVYSIEAVKIVGNRLHTELQLTVVKEASITYTTA